MGERERERDWLFCCQLYSTYLPPGKHHQPPLSIHLPFPTTISLSFFSVSSPPHCLAGGGADGGDGGRSTLITVAMVEVEMDGSDGEIVIVVVMRLVVVFGR